MDEDRFVKESISKLDTALFASYKNGCDESFHSILSYLKKNKDKFTSEEVDNINYAIARYISRYTNNETDVLNIEAILSLLLERENMSIYDIKHLKLGGFSNVFRLNNTVLKVGFNRATEEIPDNSKMLVPEFRRRIGNLFIEITDYCPLKNASYGDLCILYSALRDEGVTWVDPNHLNVGVINNRLIVKQIDRRKNIKELGIISNPLMEEVNLKEGDLVIIDVDHLVFDEEKDRIKELKNLLNEDTEQTLYMLEKEYNKGKVLKKEQKRSGI